MNMLRNRVVLFVTCSVLLSIGCQTTDPNKATATLTAPNSSISALGQSTLEVFGADGFKPVANSRGEYIFEKPAGAFSNIAYGGLLDSSVWLRVVVRIRPIDETTHQLSADAFRVRDRGSSIEETDHLGARHASRYEALLQAVIDRQ